MRDLLKDKLYWDRYISFCSTKLLSSVERIASGKVPDDMVSFAKRGQVESLIHSLIAKYSAGFQVVDLKQELTAIIRKIDSFWDEDVLLVTSDKMDFKQLNLVNYDHFLWTLSLAYLFELKDFYFDKLAGVIDRIGVKDRLYEFILKARIPSRPSLAEESYVKYFGIPKYYQRLRDSTVETDEKK